MIVITYTNTYTTFDNTNNIFVSVSAVEWGVDVVSLVIDEVVVCIMWCRQQVPSISDENAQNVATSDEDQVRLLLCFGYANYLRYCVYATYLLLRSRYSVAFVWLASFSGPNPRYVGFPNVNFWDLLDEDFLQAGCCSCCWNISVKSLRGVSR